MTSIKLSIAQHIVSKYWYLSLEMVVLKLSLKLLEIRLRRNYEEILIFGCPPRFAGCELRA